MQKLYTELIGFPIFCEYSQSPVSYVQDVLIDPENGRVSAFVVKNKQIIVPFDIERFTSSGIFIRDTHSLLPVSDVLRVQKIAEMQIGIIGEKAVTEKQKHYIGRVANYEIDTVAMQLVKIHVAKILFFFQFQERLISYRNIVKITKDHVVVKDIAEEKSEQKAVARSSVFAS